MTYLSRHPIPGRAIVLFALSFLLLAMMTNSDSSRLNPTPHGSQIVPGVIGASAGDLTSYLHPEKNKGDGGCSWFGSSPICQPNSCASDYEYVAMSGGWVDRSYNYDVTKAGNVMSKYGGECAFFTKKRLCCKVNTGDCNWTGVWESVGASVRGSRWRRSYKVYPSGFVYCTYKNESINALDCGKVVCHWNEQGESESYVTGPHCNIVELYGAVGTAHCGKIVWEVIVNGFEMTTVWYKVR